jgi:hypothetical protein
MARNEIHAPQLRRASREPLRAERNTEDVQMSALRDRAQDTDVCLCPLE